MSLDVESKGVISSSLVMAALAPQPRQPRPSIVVENSAGEVKDNI